MSHRPSEGHEISVSSPSTAFLRYLLGHILCVWSTRMRNEGHAPRPSLRPPPPWSDPINNQHRRTPTPPSASSSWVQSIFPVGCLAANCHISSSSKVNLPSVWALVSAKINAVLLPVCASVAPDLALGGGRVSLAGPLFSATRSIRATGLKRAAAAHFI